MKVRRERSIRRRLREVAFGHVTLKREQRSVLLLPSLEKLGELAVIVILRIRRGAKTHPLTPHKIRVGSLTVVQADSCILVGDVLVRRPFCVVVDIDPDIASGQALAFVRNTVELPVLHVTLASVVLVTGCIAFIELEQVFRFAPGKKFRVTALRASLEEQGSFVLRFVRKKLGWFTDGLALGLTLVHGSGDARYDQCKSNIEDCVGKHNEDNAMPNR